MKELTSSFDHEDVEQMKEGRSNEAAEANEEISLERQEEVS